jgi:hypothetical protein
VTGQRWETISANNAKPGGAGNYPRGETLAVLRQIGQETAQELREQTDEHLDRTRSTPLTDSNPVSAERVTELE